MQRQNAVPMAPHVAAAMLEEYRKLACASTSESLNAQNVEREKDSSSFFADVRAYSDGLIEFSTSLADGTSAARLLLRSAMEELELLSAQERTQSESLRGMRKTLRFLGTSIDQWVSSVLRSIATQAPWDEARSLSPLAEAANLLSSLASVAATNSACFQQSGQVTRESSGSALGRTRSTGINVDDTDSADVGRDFHKAPPSVQQAMIQLSAAFSRLTPQIQEMAAAHYKETDAQVRDMARAVCNHACSLVNKSLVKTVCDVPSTLRPMAATSTIKALSHVWSAASTWTDPATGDMALLGEVSALRESAQRLNSAVEASLKLVTLDAPPSAPTLPMRPRDAAHRLAAHTKRDRPTTDASVEGDLDSQSASPRDTTVALRPLLSTVTDTVVVEEQFTQRRPPQPAPPPPPAAVEPVVLAAPQPSAPAAPTRPFVSPAPAVPAAAKPRFTARPLPPPTPTTNSESSSQRPSQRSSLGALSQGSASEMEEAESKRAHLFNLFGLFS